MKRILSTILVLCMLLGVCPAVLADAETEMSAVDKLYALGLLQDNGTGAAGVPFFKINQEVSRIDALVTLVRLLGKEDEALSGTYQHPFTDVPTWADAYVGYACETGLTNGVSSTRFDPDSKASANVCFTYVLRALGYCDHGEAADFSYPQANMFAKALGLTAREYDTYLCGDLAETLLAALTQPMNGTTTLLIDELIRTGAVDAQTAAEIIGYTETERSIPFPLNADGNIDANQILEIFPTAAGILASQPSFNDDWLAFNGFDEVGYQLMMWAMVNDNYFESGRLLNYRELNPGRTFPMQTFPCFHNYFVFVVDDVLQVLGYLAIDEDYDSVTCTVWNCDLEGLLKEYIGNVQKHIGNAAEHTLSVDGALCYGSGMGVYADYAAYLDGQPLPDGVYIDMCFLINNDKADAWHALQNSVFQEIYNPILRKGENGLERYLTHTDYAEYNCPIMQADGNSSIRLYSSSEYKTLIIVYDRDINVLGYGVLEPYDFTQND